MCEMRSLRSFATILGLVLGLGALAGIADEQAAKVESAAVEKPEAAVDGGVVKGMINSPYAKLADSVVYIKEIKGVEFPPPKKNPVMDQKNKIFNPHVLPVLVGSTVDFPNTDDVRHSVYSREKSANDFNLGQYDAGIVKRVKLDKTGITHLGCNVHVEMSAYIIALQNPYFSIANRKDRTFSIPNVPAGTWELTFYHEKIEPAVLEVTVEAGKETEVEFSKLKRKR